MAYNRKNFTMGPGKYYFQIRSGQQLITICRKTKDAAEQAFSKYLQVGKNVDWLGKWNGKTFVETSEPKLATS
ncbi:MAG: hypothetical protein R2769_01685 [Saprospiraceae bacterium]